MKYVSAYLLATLGGNASPSVKDVEKILGSAGLDVDIENATKVVNALKGKDVEDVIAAGQSKLASVPAGGAAPAAVVSSDAAAAPAEVAPAKKEEKKEESEDEDMGFGLFD